MVGRIESEWCRVLGAGEGSGMVPQGRERPIPRACAQTQAAFGVNETWWAGSCGWSAAVEKQGGGDVKEQLKCRWSREVCQAGGEPVGQGPVGLGFVSAVPKQFSTCVSRVTGKRNCSGFVPCNW